MIQQRMHHMSSEIPKIDISQGSFVIGEDWKDKDWFDLTVTPDDMDWTVTIENTGDGTTWVACHPSSGTGGLVDPNIYMMAEVDNDTGLDRYADVRFSDDAGGADDIVLEVMQEANIV